MHVGDGEREMDIYPVCPATWMLWTRRWRASRGVRRGMENVPVGVVFVAVSLLITLTFHSCLKTGSLPR